MQYDYVLLRNKLTIPLFENKKKIMEKNLLAKNKLSKKKFMGKIVRTNSVKNNYKNNSATPLPEKCEVYTITPNAKKEANGLVVLLVSSYIT